MRTYRKPVLLLSGNHEAYSEPYGISPRVSEEAVRAAWDAHESRLDYLAADAGASTRGGTFRANAGIPADHNLTMTEAILMYGPDYARAPMSGLEPGWRTTNFQPREKDWFYTVFSPLTDFVLEFAEQRLIALGWGDAERFVGTGGMGSVGGMLPRAVESVSPAQLALLQDALRRQPKPLNLLLSHFTYVNYDPAKPLSEAGHIDYATQSDYNTGTFEANRGPVYDRLRGESLLATLSGHVHRAGLYTLQAAPAPRLGVRAQPPDAAGRYRPRFAVALDYADILGPGVFTRFASRSPTAPFEIRLNPALKLPGEVRLINRVGLALMQGRTVTHYPMALFFEPLGKYLARFEGGKETAGHIDDSLRGKHGQALLFLSVDFTEALSERLEFAQYHFGSAWTFQVELRGVAALAVEENPALPPAAQAGALLGMTLAFGRGSQGYLIRRAPKHGEVPDHACYARNFPEEYGFDAAKSRRKNPRKAMDD